MNKKTVLLVFALTLTMLATGGCSNTAKTKNSNSSQNTGTDSDNTEPGPGHDGTDSIISVSAADLFTDRDKEISYDKDSCISITLDDKKTSCESDTVKLNGSTVTITEEGNYILTGALTDGMVIVDADKDSKIQLILDNVSVNSASSSALYVKQAEKVFLTTAANSKNTLSNGGSYQAIDNTNIDAAIYSKEDLTLNGAGILTVKAEAGHGIVSKDSLVLTSGQYDITAARHGLSGKDNVCIADGTFKITAGKDGIHAENKDDTSQGFVFISTGEFKIDSADDGLHSNANISITGGDYEITSGDDGIHANADVAISNGNINIPKCYEGIEGQTITVAGGDISLISDDDGFNAAGGADSSGFGNHQDEFTASDDTFIKITGGKIRMKVSGDGLDSNGNLYVSGGEVYISGPEGSGNGSLDYAREGTISGGTVIAAGAMGMVQNFGSASTQGSILVSTGAGNTGDNISLTNAKGKELLSWQTECEYSCVIMSTPEIAKGETYTLKTGSNKQEITMSELIYGESRGGMGGGKGRGGGKRPDGKMPGDGTMPDSSAKPKMPGDGEPPEKPSL